MDVIKPRCKILPDRIPAKTLATVENSALQALTVAALALPGLMLTTAEAADGDQANFQYGFYQEGQRTLLESYKTLHLEPISVNNLNAGGNMTFFDRVKFAFNYTQDTWTGATPLTSAPAASMFLTTSGASMAISSSVLIDQQLRNFYKIGPGLTPVKDDRTVHMMTMASPETRKQGDFRLGYEWDEAALNLNGGVSVEDDYNSHFIGADGRMDFNAKRTTLNVGLNYTDSLINARRDPQYASYINYSTVFDPAYLNQVGPDGKPLPLTGERKDWSGRLGLTQVLNKNTVVRAGIGYTSSSGFLENPYKVAELLFVDPSLPPDENGLLTADTQGVLERRPNNRHQWNFNIGSVHYLPLFDASLHLDYRFFHDDWGINAHTFELAWGQPLGRGWTITPRAHYYSQSAADFYSPFFIINRAKFDANFEMNLSALPLADFSSDQRLSGYGALSGGVTISKQFAKGINLNTGFEYYTHQGGLKMGAGGEDKFANFSYYQISAALRVDFSALANLAGPSGGSDAHAGHVGHAVHPGHAPAGVMFDHMLDKAGGVMVGYRYMYSPQDGDTLYGSHPASDAQIVRHGCKHLECSTTPTEHTMHMHMVEFMYAPTDWLTLMLMPQFSDMTMEQRKLEGAAAEPDNGGHNHGGGNSFEHATGGIGDTGMYAMVKLFDFPGHHMLSGHHLHATVGFSAPSGDVRQKINGQKLIHYGMQLGSGTWDFHPSLTYTGHLDGWSWGAQLSGIKRLQAANEVGYALGNVFQSTAWGSYNLFDWLSASLRGVYTDQGEIRGAYNAPQEDSAPVDFPGNYGGKFWDVGIGLNALVTGGQFQGNRIGVEWLQPVYQDVNGYQLQREGGLSATWSLAF